jgi:peptide-methionine (S)-S-oxide reductase
MRIFILLLTVLWGGWAMAQEPVRSEPDMTETKTAILAGGCFWCLEPPYDNADGVLNTEVGYTGGSVPNPTYEEIGTGKTGHREAIRITYDPEKISYAELLDIFWNTIDVDDAGGQYADRGFQYTTAIYVANEEERQIAEESKAALEKKSGKKVATVIEKAAVFYPAEDYHQDYYQKNPVRYKMYKYGSGRG